VGLDGSSFCSFFFFTVKDDEFLTWTTLRLLIAFGGYFALGAYYNYTTYGATGADLIPCVPSSLLVALILKRLSLAVDIEISGARCHTCYETLSRIFVVLSNHDTARVGEAILRYNPCFHTSFLWIILQGCVNELDCLQALSPSKSTARRPGPFRYIIQGFEDNRIIAD
jgi:hypothetical protein